MRNSISERPILRSQVSSSESTQDVNNSMEKRSVQLSKHLETDTGRRGPCEQSKDWILQYENLKQRLYEESLPEVAQEIGKLSRILKIRDGSIHDQCLDFVMVHVIIDESSYPSRIKLHNQLGYVQEYELRGSSELDWIPSEIDMESSRRRYSEYEVHWKQGSFMDEIFVTWMI